MLYSCFDQDRGDYRVYRDSSTRPINGDLPVPDMPADTGNIGVPTEDAARPFPSGAKYVGRSWRAQGMVVRCSGGALGNAGDFLSSVKPVHIAVVVGFAALLWWAQKRLGASS